VNDCIYVALAVKERGFLVTSDEALARKFTNPKPKAKQVIQLLKNWHP
jgi:predicted nucleic acid-binding protein